MFFSYENPLLCQKMISPTQFFSVFGMIAVSDCIWLSCNSYFANGIYYSIKENFLSKTVSGFPISVLYALACWIISALYVTGHSYDNLGDAFLEGAWVGSLVYGVFNFTSLVVAPYWGEFKIRPIVDTLWGTILFGCAACVAHSLN